jgi:hypothetical protein
MPSEPRLSRCLGRAVHRHSDVSGCQKLTQMTDSDGIFRKPSGENARSESVYRGVDAAVMRADSFDLIGWIVMSILMSMSKRLQIVMPDEEIEEMRRTAEQAGMSLSEWARLALRRAQRSQRGPTAEDKLKAVERALECGHPTGAIQEVLADIEKGRDLH